ncbi:hypothetical protein BLA6863_01069 [Burkholderia lata]|uniref:Uncharacterized protein n=1 Tax=Burkholderia lata (strain ATCC 17760 / DSM 23089 / LMG 22485 / NCIMB 9086 / R18194 / 383) TaxID=482957 RepID=A0A6P2IB94_BURL3|nr:hypothetical protein BLA6863_01069 [Burkholderia lata]
MVRTTRSIGFARESALCHAPCGWQSCESMTLREPIGSAIPVNWPAQAA